MGGLMKNKSFLILLIFLILIFVISIVTFKPFFLNLLNKNKNLTSASEINENDYIMLSFKVSSKAVKFEKNGIEENLTLSRPLVLNDNQAYINDNFFKNVIEIVPSPHTKASDSSKNTIIIFILNNGSYQFAKVPNNVNKISYKYIIEQLPENNEDIVKVSFGQKKIRDIDLSFKDDNSVPLRSLFEKLGFRVNWIKSKNEIIVYNSYMKYLDVIKDAGNWTLPVIDNSYVYSYNSYEYKNFDNIELMDTLINPEVKAVIVTFWATWKEPQKRALIYYDRLYKKYEDLGIVVFGIPIDSEIKQKDLILSKLRELPLSYPILWSSDNKLKQYYNINTESATYLIDKKNKIRYENTGFTPADINNTEKALLALLNE
jgi:thiol-disulfide isomerase/thioredoxin